MSGSPPGAQRPGLPAGLMPTLRVVSAVATVLAFLLFGVSLLGSLPGLWSLRGAAGHDAGRIAAGMGAVAISPPAPLPRDTAGGAAERTLATDGPPAAGDAAALWRRGCQLCHGRDGVPSPMGVKLGARDLTSPAAQALPDADLRRSISEGKGKMPAFRASLTPADIDSLVGLVRGLRKDPGPPR